MAAEVELCRAAVPSPLPPAPLTDLPTLGIASLMELFDDDLAQVVELLETALGLMEADLKRIVQAAAVDDVHTVREAAHRMKGTSGGIGAQQVMAISATIQQAATHDPSAVDFALLTSLADAVARVGAALEASRSR